MGARAVNSPAVNSPAVNHAARLPAFIGCSGDVAVSLAAASVAVVGAGSVGLAALLHLARMGVGTLQIVDRGVLKAESTLTHPIPPAASGRLKAEYAGEAVRAIAPDAEVVVHQAAFQDLPVDAIHADVVVMATDNLAVEIAVGQRCLNLGIPLVHASVLGSLMVAQLRTFTGGQHGEGACPACLFGSTEWQQVSTESRLACDGSTTAHGESLAPTQSTSSLCSLAAELAVHRVLRHLLGLGAPLADQILEYQGYTDRLETSELCRSAKCPVEHQRWQIAPRRDAGTLAAVLGQSGLDAPSSVAVDRARFVAEAACGCSSWQSVGRFVADGEALGRCGHCGGELQASPFHSHAEVAVSGWPDGWPISKATIPKDRAVVVRGQDGRVVMLTNRMNKHEQ